MKLLKYFTKNLLLVLLFFANSLTSSEDHCKNFYTLEQKEKILSNVSKSFDNFHSMRVQFVEYKLKKNGKNFVVSGDGMLWFQSPQKLRMAYHGNLRRYIICDGKNILIKEHVDVYPLVLKLQNWPLRFIFKRPIELYKLLYYPQLKIDIEESKGNTKIIFFPLNKNHKPIGYKLILLLKKNTNKYIFDGWEIHYPNGRAVRIIFVEKARLFNILFEPETFLISGLRPKKLTNK